MKPFKVGDTVVIHNLDNGSGGTYNGIIGHVAVITDISGIFTPWAHLSPSCTGGAWELHNLRHYPSMEEGCCTKEEIAPSKTPAIVPILINVPKI